MQLQVWLHSNIPSLFEQDIGALLEADDALEYDDDEFEQITEETIL